MAVTLAQAGFLGTDMMKTGIIKTILNESPFARALPFITIEGNAYDYNLETTAGGANWYLSNETISEQTPVWEQRSTSLAQLIGDADVDKFLNQVRSKDQNLKSSVIELAGAAIADEFEKQCIFGQETTSYSTKQMKGLWKLIAEVEGASVTDWDKSENSQLLNAAADASATLTLDFIDELLDLIKPGMADALIMNRKMRRKMGSLARATNGQNMEHDKDQLGFPVTRYGGIPIQISDHLPTNMGDPTSSDYDVRAYAHTDGNDTSCIIALKWGERGIAGIQNGGITHEDLGTLEQKNATRTRIIWYVGMANFSKSSIAVGYGFTHD